MVGLKIRVNFYHPSVLFFSDKAHPLITVKMYKGPNGLGISLEGGKESPLGDRPLSIKRVFKGGAADKTGQLKVGDKIMAINGFSLTNMTHLEAWNLLKTLPDGDISLLIMPAIKCSEQ